MADMAVKIQSLSGDEAILAKAGSLMLLIVFGLKAAILPLHFWLPQAYSTTTGVVAALFAIMTKVGVYSIIRVYSLIFGADANEFALVAHDWLWIMGLLTLLAGAIGILAARDLRLMVAYLVGYLGGLAGRCLQPVFDRYYGCHAILSNSFDFYYGGAVFACRPDGLTNAIKTASRIVSGKKMANYSTYATFFLIGAIAIIGLPPFSGFVSKLMILESAAANGHNFWLWAAIIGATFIMLVAVTRAGSKMIWHTLSGKPSEHSAPLGKRLALASLLSLSLLINAVCPADSRYHRCHG